MYYNNTQASTMQPSYPGHVDNAKLSGLALAADRKPISFFFSFIYFFFYLRRHKTFFSVCESINCEIFKIKIQ